MINKKTIDIPVLKREIHKVALETYKKDIFSKSRKRELVIPRQSLMYVLVHHLPQQYFKLSYQTIGKICSSNGQPFDHSTVCHSIKKAKIESQYQDRQDNVDFWYSKIDEIINDSQKFHITAETMKYMEWVQNTLNLEPRQLKEHLKLKRLIRIKLK